MRILIFNKVVGGDAPPDRSCPALIEDDFVCCARSYAIKQLQTITFRTTNLTGSRTSANPLCATVSARRLYGN